MKLKKFLTGLNAPTPAFLPVAMILLFMLALVGCAGHEPAKGEFEETPVTIEVKVPYLCGQPPPVDVVIMRDINWDIITLDDIDLYTLTVDDYKALGLNTSDWIAASRQMKEQRNFYRDCIIRSRQEIHDENLDSGLVPNPPGE